MGIAGAHLVSATTASIIGAAIGIGGNMLINAFMPPVLGKPKNTGATYDPTGPSSGR